MGRRRGRCSGQGRGAPQPPRRGGEERGGSPLSPRLPQQTPRRPGGPGAQAGRPGRVGAEPACWGRLGDPLPEGGRPPHPPGSGPRRRGAGPRRPLPRRHAPERAAACAPKTQVRKGVLRGHPTRDRDRCVGGHGDPVTARLGLGEGAGIPVRRTPLRATPPGLEWTGEGGFGGPRLHPAPRTSRWGPRGAGSRRGRGTPCAPACKAPCASPPAPQGRALALEGTLTGSKLWGDLRAGLSPGAAHWPWSPRGTARGRAGEWTCPLAGSPGTLSGSPRSRTRVWERGRARTAGQREQLEGPARPGQARPVQGRLWGLGWGTLVCNWGDLLVGSLRAPSTLSGACLCPPTLCSPLRVWGGPAGALNYAGTWPGFSSCSSSRQLSPGPAAPPSPRAKKGPGASEGSRGAAKSGTRSWTPLSSSARVWALTSGSCEQVRTPPPHSHAPPWLRVLFWGTTKVPHPGVWCVQDFCSFGERLRHLPRFWRCQLGYGRWMFLGGVYVAGADTAVRTSGLWGC